MKRRRLLSLFLTLSLCGGLFAVPASAFDTATAGVTNVVSVGFENIAIVDKDHNLWMAGPNDAAELGIVGVGNRDITHETLTTKSRLCQDTFFKVMEDVASVCCGDGFTAAIKTDGSLWMWGRNDHGEIGNGGVTDFSGHAGGDMTIVAQSAPVKIMDNVTAVSCGVAFVAAIKTDGSLWMWGRNSSGELGNGLEGNSTYRGLGRSPIQTVPVKIMDDVRMVSCGGAHTAAIKTDGSLWVWGANNAGQLGNGRVGNQTRETGYVETIQTVPLKLMDNVESVACGSTHTAIVKTDGSLWMCGDNKYGELGNGGECNAVDEDSPTYPVQTVPVKIMDDVASVSAGSMYPSTAIVRKDGSLWMCGDNLYGQMGNITFNTGHDAGRDHAIEATPVQVTENIGGDVVSVSCGGASVAALKKDGTVWVWGNNTYGQLGIGEDSSDNIYWREYGGLNGVFSENYTLHCGAGFPHQVKALTATPPSAFRIVSSWAQEEIAAAESAGLIPTLTDNPNYQAPITREQFAELAVNAVMKMSNGVTTNGTADFTDTDNMQVRRAAGMGIVNGVGEGRFDPKATISREQIATMLHRAWGLTGTPVPAISLSSYTDAGEVSNWAVDAVGSMTASGIMKGTSDTVLSPQAPCTVEQAILLVYRLYQEVK